MRAGVLVAMLASVAGWASGAALQYDPGSDPVLGFNIWGAQKPPVSTAAWESAIQTMHDRGFRHVAIGHWRYMNVDTGQVTTTNPSTWRGAAPDADIAAAVARAKSLGMSVTLRTFIEPYQNTANGPQYPWRGEVNTTNANRATFWSQYTPFVTQMAQMAQGYGVDRLMVGVEMEQLARDAANSPYWTQLINSVNTVYSGQIGYGANHGGEKDPVVTSTIWNNPHVSFMGTSAYFPLASTAEADNSSSTAFGPLMQQRIGAIVDDLTTFAAAQQGGKGLDVVFSEFGSPPFNRGSVTPWDWNLATTQPPDSEEQYKVYEALLRATDGRAADRFDEVNVWVWGWPGGYNNETFGFNPYPSTANETLNLPTYQLLESYVPEPSGAAGILLAFCAILRRRS